MSRKLTYNTTRFDGGMTSSPRDVNQRDRFAYLSHFDIYRDTGKMYVMPGFVSDNGYDGSATGLKQFGIKNFVNVFGTVYGLGTKSDGTGSKIMQRTITDSEWKVPTTVDYQGEGTKNLPTRPFFVHLDGDFYYPEVDATQLDIAKSGSSANAFAGGYESEWVNNWVADATTPNYLHAVKAFDGVYYLNRAGFSGIDSLKTSGVVTAKTTALFPRTLASGDYTIGIFGAQSNPRESRVLIWDSASLLADQNVKLGAEQVLVSGFPNGLYCAVSVGSLIYKVEENGKGFMSIRILSGETAQMIYRTDLPTDTNQAVHDLNDYYYDSMIWYARLPTNSAGSEFNEGIWAFGSSSNQTQFGVSVLLDTSSLGLVQRAQSFGSSIYFAHGDDGSVSRLDNFETGTFDVPATCETVWYGNETPYQKELNGISVVTSPLPASASVEMFYRVNDSDSWTSMGTSDTTGKMKHIFTRVAGAPIGKFQEIQFKFTVTGKVAVQNMFINLTETDDLAF